MAVDVEFLNGNNVNNINNNFQRVKDALQEAVGRNGNIPNHMNADLDMNSNDILNIDSIDIQRIVLNGEEFDPRQMRGWAPVFSAIEYNGTVVMKLIDYVGGYGIKPTQYIDWYVGSTGYVQDINQATGFGSSGVTDGDKGDITVSNSGTVWDLNKNFDTVSELLSDESMGYLGSGSPTTVSDGDIVTAQDFRYEVAASDAVDAHVETAGGVKLYVLPSSRGYDVTAFGAVGDLVWPGGTGTDNTVAIQKAMNAGMAEGREVHFPGGRYRVTDTIYLLNSEYQRSFAITGESGNSTWLLFDNSDSLKDLFYCDSAINYLKITDIELIDLNAGTSRAFFMFDNRDDDKGPSWKHLFDRIRVTGFGEGVRFNGGATNADDTHESEVMFLHSKFRNCRKSIIYNNTQAVNHQLIGLDIENDTEASGEVWPMIVFERGTTINHLGGSVIGKGSYLTFKYSVAGGFQNTSQFVSRGVRVEKRGAYATPVIDHDPTSTITLSNSLRVIVEDMPVVYSGDTGVPVFARVGGRVRLDLRNVHGNAQATVDAYATVNMGSNSEVGSVDIIDCKALTYKRISDVAAYGSAGIGSSSLISIPAKQRLRTEGVQGSVVGGYYTLQNAEVDIYAGGFQTSTPKTFVLAPSGTAGIGSGNSDFSSLIRLPLYARPFKFRLLRDDVNAGSPFVLTLFAEVGGTDYQVATITPTADTGGHFEANVQTATGLTYFIRDDVNWDGKMRIKKTGTVNGFVGLIMIDYM